jgi:hypothetical protein
MLEAGRIRLNDSIQYTDIFGNKVQGMLEYLEDEQQSVDSNWTDIEGYRYAANFSTENAEVLLKRVILITTRPGDVVMDFFLGSGTACAVAHKLGRRWIGIEMGEHFYTHVLPRMKRVVCYDGSGISQHNDVRQVYNKSRSGGMFKYYELETFEQIISRLGMQDTQAVDASIDNILDQPFLADLKLLDVVAISDDDITLDLKALYGEEVDVAESLSNLLGHPIDRIQADSVTFAGGIVISTTNDAAQHLKPYLWW